MVGRKTREVLALLALAAPRPITAAGSPTGSGTTRRRRRSKPCRRTSPGPHRARRGRGRPVGERLPRRRRACRAGRARRRGPPPPGQGRGARRARSRRRGLARKARRQVARRAGAAYPRGRRRTRAAGRGAPAAGGGPPRRGGRRGPPDAVPGAPALTAATRCASGSGASRSRRCTGAGGRPTRSRRTRPPAVTCATRSDGARPAAASAGGGGSAAHPPGHRAARAEPARARVRRTPYADADGRHVACGVYGTVPSTCCCSTRPSCPSTPTARRRTWRTPSDGWRRGVGWWRSTGAGWACPTRSRRRRRRAWPSGRPTPSPCWTRAAPAASTCWPTPTPG